MIILALINALILLGLAVLHFYWALGGKWGFYQALPSKDDGQRLFTPGFIESFIVGLFLSFFSLMHVAHLGYLKAGPEWVNVYALYFISGLFLLRSIGDFRYIGFFKKVKTTTFGRADSNYYSPLCLFISAAALTVVLCL